MRYKVEKRGDLYFPCDSLQKKDGITFVPMGYTYGFEDKEKCRVICKKLSGWGRDGKRKQINSKRRSAKAS